PTRYMPATERTRFPGRRAADCWSVGSTEKALPSTAPSASRKSRGVMRCSTRTEPPSPASPYVVSRSATTASRRRSDSASQSMPARRLGAGSSTASESPPLRRHGRLGARGRVHVGGEGSRKAAAARDVGDELAVAAPHEQRVVQERRVHPVSAEVEQ